MFSPVSIIAHRGASEQTPENTISAINLALELQADYVEIDVRVSKEGIPVVLHDPSAARMIGAASSPPIDELALLQIQQIDIGRLFGKAFVGEKIPTLMEVLNLNWNQTGLMIEIKECSERPEILVSKIFNVISNIKKTPPDIIFGSFSPDIIREVQRQSPMLNSPIKTIGIVEEPDLLHPFLEQGLKHLALWYKIVTPELMRSLKEKEICVWTFTVDDFNVAHFLISLGISGIITNIPKKMKENCFFNLH